MKRTNVVVAFAAGWASAALCGWIANGARLHADGDDQIHVCVAASGVLRVVSLTAPCPPSEASLMLKKWAPDSVDVPDGDARHLSASPGQPDLAALEKQVKALEDAAEKGALSNRVVAPFEVDDRQGKRILYVEEGHVRMYNAAGAEVIHIGATDTGGTFVGKSSTGTLKAVLGAGALDGVPMAGLRLMEGDADRVTIGRAKGGTGSYVALFNSKSGARVAGIGQSQAGHGAAYVADEQGNVRGVMRIDTDGTGLIAVNGAGDKTVGSLTEDTAGGVLTLRSTDGTPMVVAGTDTGGFGVVRAGPESFKPGMGVLGLPGSYLAGKPK